MMKIISFSVIGIVLFFLFKINSILGTISTIVFPFLAYTFTKMHRERAGDYEKLYQNFPWISQNMSQTISIAKKSGYQIDEKDFGSVALFYRTMKTYLRGYFKITVNEEVITSYEKKIWCWFNKNKSRHP